MSQGTALIRMRPSAVVSIQELSNDVSFFCAIWMNNRPVHDFRLGKGNAISIIIANGLLSVCRKVTGDCAGLNLINDYEHNFEFRMRAIPQLRCEGEQIFRGESR